MYGEPSFRPPNPRPAKQNKWVLPVALIGGSCVSVGCALAFVIGAFLWEPVVPTPRSQPPTPGGDVVRYVTEVPGAQQSAPPTPVPPGPTNAPAPAPAQPPTDTPPAQVAAAPSPAAPAQPTTKPASKPTPKPTQAPEPTQAPKPTKKPAASAGAANVFAYGIQVDPAGAAKTIINDLNKLGIRWVKFQLSWKDIEPQQGTYNWGAWDQIMLTYNRAGFHVLLSVVKAPDWARPKNTDLSQEGPPADPNTFARFVGEMSQRYRTGVHAIEVWNEQNLAREGGGAPMPAQNYIALLSAAYNTIKTVDRSVIVVSGGPTPAGDVPGAAIDDITYLGQMYAAGLKGVSDAVGVHPSGYNCPADADWQSVSDPTATFRGPFDNRHHSWCFRGTMEGYRNVMVANGDSNKLLWPTEFGWAVANPPPPSYEYAADNTRQEQAQWIVSAYEQAKAWGWVGPMFLWNLNYGVTKPGSEQAAFSILMPEGATPAYQALAALPK
jgi:hypothetical protein